ncbi:Ca2+-transporting ATPase [Fusarium albosuccineum]|uniref:Ca2+-transporting ATPase n=1 Tax=Fusarium albosuccineum TaxID=1237068 RepID=A0A8H4L7R0_9HYPO|nr:Ca2+-transporting ATPase [Fusarium albosuccineum]
MRCPRITSTTQDNWVRVAAPGRQKAPGVGDKNASCDEQYDGGLERKELEAERTLRGAAIGEIDEEIGTLHNLIGTKCAMSHAQKINIRMLLNASLHRSPSQLDFSSPADIMAASNEYQNIFHWAKTQMDGAVPLNYCTNFDSYLTSTLLNNTISTFCCKKPWLATPLFNECYCSLILLCFLPYRASVAPGVTLPGSQRPFHTGWLRNMTPYLVMWKMVAPKALARPGAMLQTRKTGVNDENPVHESSTPADLGLIGIAVIEGEKNVDLKGASNGQSEVARFLEGVVVGDQHLGQRLAVPMDETIPFDSQCKYSAIVIKLANGKSRVFAKGASEILLQKCSKTSENVSQGDSDSGA